MNFKAVIHSFIIILIIISSVLIGLYQLSSPAPQPKNAPLADFSSGRAMALLADISKKPHPILSDEHERVKLYIMNQITGLGLVPKIQSTGNTPYNNSSSSIQNIIVKLNGKAYHKKALLLMCHYDTVTVAPGASDNTAGVVTLLETLRALKSNSQLENDIIFLFNDGEEAGMIGSKAFLSNHPWAEDVGIVIGFDGSGLPIMAGTNLGNDWIVNEFKNAVPYPVGFSTSMDFIKSAPGWNDFDPFRAKGVTGLNFNFVSGKFMQHSPLDTIDYISESSIQHEGSYALSLARHFGNMDISFAGSHQSKDNAVYFNIFRGILVVYSYKLIVPIMAIIILAFLIIVAYGIRNQSITLKGIIEGFLCFGLSIFSIVIVISLLETLIEKIAGDSYRHLVQYPKYSDPIFIAFIVLSVLMVFIFYSYFCKKVNAIHLITGSLLFWILLASFLCVYLKGCSYLGEWPLVFFLTALGIIVVKGHNKAFSFKYYICLLFMIIPGIVLFTPLTYLIYTDKTLSEGAGFYGGIFASIFGVLAPYVLMHIRRIEIK